jgi:hypothetical protein
MPDPFPSPLLSHEKLLAKAELEINETEAGRSNCLRELRALIVESPFDLDRDIFLLAFLRWAKFDVDSAFRRLQRFIKFRASNKDFFTGDFSLAKDYLKNGMVQILSDRSEDGKLGSEFFFFF